jgi:hypothetical protein
LVSHEEKIKKLAKTKSSKLLFYDVALRCNAVKVENIITNIFEEFKPL